MRRIAIIGTGPTGIYSLNSLIHAEEKLEITMFEQSALAGIGTPYSPDINSDYMLANIGSIEIPPLVETYENWLLTRSDAELKNFSLERCEINERGFYPRVLLGNYFRDQLLLLQAIAQQNGHIFKILEHCFVVDVELKRSSIIVHNKSYSFSYSRAEFDHVIMATGHSYVILQKESHRLLSSPWPYKKLDKIRNKKIGILGTSLSAIDAFVGIVSNHGSFEYNINHILEFRPRSDITKLEIVLMSRKGILPEADFYCPLPYLPLEIFTAEIVENLIKHCDVSALLDETFALFKRQLQFSDPEYAERISLKNLTLENFKEAYFHPRLQSEPFAWAQKNLDEAATNYENKITVGWRYAILRMHELFGEIVPYLNDKQLERFNTFLKPVFVDDYASVPHESIKRLLAAHAACILSIRKVTDDYVINTSDGGESIDIECGLFHEKFDYIINATGNNPLSAADFPFQRIVDQAEVSEDVISDQATDKSNAFHKFELSLDDVFRLIVGPDYSKEFYCLSIPHILDKYPFIQGLEGSHKLASIAVGSILDNSHTGPQLEP